MCMKLVSVYNATNQLAEIQALNMKWTSGETEFFLVVLKSKPGLLQCVIEYKMWLSILCWYHGFILN